MPEDHSEQERALEEYTGKIRVFIEAHAPAEFELYEWACAQFDEQWQARS